jgi:hypothetical protein
MTDLRILQEGRRRRSEREARRRRARRRHRIRIALSVLGIGLAAMLLFMATGAREPDPARPHPAGPARINAATATG